MAPHWIGAALLFLLANQLFAGPLSDHETPGTNRYTLAFGAPGEGTDSLPGTGLADHDALGRGMSLRLFDGQPGGSQQSGVYQIQFKNQRRGADEDEFVSDLLPNRVPAIGSSMPGGGRFDGTALWLGHSRFLPGSTTAWNGDRWAKADTGSAVRPDREHLIEVPVLTGQATNVSYLISQHVYVPGHRTGRAVPRGVYVQPFVEREGFGGTTPGGLGYRMIEFPGDQWCLLELRADFSTDGGERADPAALRRGTGPIRFGPAFGLTRGWQGSAPEAFIDNITVRPIHREH
jgi:hypothetical protein